ncbi:MAG: succinate dehydrogenase cytochrome b subunit [Planctomycetales bacterium]
MRMLEAVGLVWLLRGISSSIGRKLIMAITGLGLCGFLAVHLAGNLLLYAGAEPYEDYAHALHAQKFLLPIAEVGLLLLFIGHLWLALTTHFKNLAARPQDYVVRQSKQPPSPLVVPASSVMFATGIVVLLFLLLHLSDFRFNLRKDYTGVAEFKRAVSILQDPLSAIVYAVGSLVLGVHVWHGFQSAFQTLGFNHPKYTPAIKFLSLLFAITVALGFASFPLWAWAFHK